MNHLEHTYQAFAASSAAVLCGSGKKGDILARLIVTVVTSGATGIASITDGNGSAIPLVTSGAAVGVYSIKLGAIARNATSPGWKVTTGAGASAVAVGQFI